jgi:hypothetical protein
MNNAFGIVVRRLQVGELPPRAPPRSSDCQSLKHPSYELVLAEPVPWQITPRRLDNRRERLDQRRCIFSRQAFSSPVAKPSRRPRAATARRITGNERTQTSHPRCGRRAGPATPKGICRLLDQAPRSAVRIDRAIRDGLRPRVVAQPKRTLGNESMAATWSAISHPRVTALSLPERGRKGTASRTKGRRLRLRIAPG